MVILLLAVGAGIGIGIYIGATKDNGTTQNAKVITDNGVEANGDTGGNTGGNNGNTDGDDINDKKTTESMKGTEKQDTQNPFRATRKRKFNQPASIY